MKQRKGWRMSCDVGKASSFSNLSVTSPTSQLIFQPFPRFTYVTTHSRTLPSLYLRHSSFSNHSVTSPTSQLILQPFFRFSYVTGSSLSSPGEPPMILKYLNDGKLLEIFSVLEWLEYLPSEGSRIPIPVIP